MRLFPKKYDRHVILFSSKRPPLWDYSVWSRNVAPWIDKLFKLVDGTPSVKSGQIYLDSFNGPKFGRIDWSENGHKKWCHNSELTKGKCHDWVFVQTQLFYPKWNILRDNFEMPLMYCEIKDLGIDGYAQNYKSCLHFVCRSDIAKNSIIEINKILSTVSDTAGGVAWYGCKSRVGAPNAFGTSLLKDFLYRGMHLDDLPDTKKMKGRWRRLA